MAVTKAMLVYQAGIANVFEVKSFSLAGIGRDAKRLYQGDFRGAFEFSKGLGCAGAVVRTAACNAAGDIVDATWTNDLDSQPFSDHLRAITAN